MAKRTNNTKKKQVAAPRQPFFGDLTPHAKQSIAALAVASLGVFFILSLLEYAGMIGTWTKIGLEYLFGAGSYLAPVACAFFVYAFLNPREDKHVSGSKLFGITLLFLALLGGFELYQATAGGLLGLGIKWPLNFLMGPLASGVFLGMFFLIGMFLTFNIGLGIPAFLRSKPLPDEDEFDTSDIDNLELPPEVGDAALPAASEEVEGEVQQEKSRKTLGGIMGGIVGGGGRSSNDDFLVTNFVGAYDPPPLSLLSRDKGKAKTGDIKASANTIKRVLKEFGIDVEMDKVEVGPTVTQYSLKPAQGVKIARILGLQRELELNLASGTIRIEAPIPGKSLVGIEVPNLERATIGLASMLASPEYTDSPKPLLVALGKDITGKVQFGNIARMPHALIAGTTGSGKSVAIHNLIISLLFRNSPEQLRFLLVDPKLVELTLYDGIPHLMVPVITDAKRALKAFKWATNEMDRRYEVLRERSVQNVETYHEKIYQPAKKVWEAGGSDENEKAELPEGLPFIVIVIDELNDLMQAYPRELEALIVRLAQKSRAVGIHLILATQRPSVDVITGTIKANIPTRIALQVRQQVDSRTILDQIGAEQLIGKGDLLFSSNESGKPIRLQSAFISEEEIKNVVNYLKKQSDSYGLDHLDLDSTSPSEGGIFAGDVGGNDGDDELFQDAKAVVMEAGKASTSLLQRRLRIGYGRAARIMDILEENGVIGPADGSKPREVLIGRGGSDDTSYEVANSDEDGDNQYM